jgi:nucleoside-diphosphate-sugar epimerase
LCNCGYGNNPVVRLVETAPACRVSPYGTDQRLGELYARMPWSRYRLPSIGLRFFNVYRPV